MYISFNISNYKNEKSYSVNIFDEKIEVLFSHIHIKIWKIAKIIFFW